MRRYSRFKYTGQVSLVLKQSMTITEGLQLSEGGLLVHGDPVLDKLQVDECVEVILVLENVGMFVSPAQMIYRTHEDTVGFRFFDVTLRNLMRVRKAFGVPSTPTQLCQEVYLSHRKPHD